MEPTWISPEELRLPQTFPLPKRTDWGIGMVGFGEFAQRAHAPDYVDAGWPIVAVAAPSIETQSAAREQFGVARVYSDFRELIDDEAVAIVDLLTQPNVREEVVKAAAQAGKPIIIEKPFGETAESCRRMVETAKSAGIPLAVHQNYRWMKGNFLAHHIVREGWIGEPFFVSIEKFGSQDSDPANSFYSTCEDYLTLHWNTHFADLFRYWTGRDAKRVSAYTARGKGQAFKSDNLFISIHDFGVGLTGHIVHSELLQSSSMGGDQCRIDGDGGSLVFDFSGNQMLLASRKLGPAAYLVRTSDLQWKEALCGSMGDLLIALEEGREPQVSGRDNLTTMNTVLAEIESARAGGRWVNVSG